MPKGKASAFISVLLVFVAGVAVGALAYRLYAANPVTAVKKMTPEEVRKLIVGRMKTEVQLDDQQVGQLQTIMDETHDGFDQISQRRHAAIDPIVKKADQENQALREQQIAKVKAMLRPDQQALYTQYLAEREAEHKKRQQEHQDHKDGKGPGGPPPSRP